MPHGVQDCTALYFHALFFEAVFSPTVGRTVRPRGAPMAFYAAANRYLDAVAHIRCRAAQVAPMPVPPIAALLFIDKKFFKYCQGILRYQTISSRDTKGL